MKKILLVFGTRPEAIKMAPLIKEFKKFPDQFDIKVCVTGQHREMLDQILDFFEINPDFDLNVMQKGQDLYDVTSRILLGMRDVLNVSKPSLVLVHGDTSTSTAAALAAFYQQIPVGHVEAGLRTHNKYSPWPEEMNRQLTGRISTYHFAPTNLNKKNLLLENINEGNIYVTGNTVIDALEWVIEKLKKDRILIKEIKRKLINLGIPIKKIEQWKGEYLNEKTDNEKKFIANKKRKLVLITGHRRENFGNGFNNICEAINYLSRKYKDVDFVYPMHLNPNVRKEIKIVIEKQILNSDSNMYFIEPLDYLPFIYLMNQSCLILTDSGGIQEEAPGLGKPVLVMRETTERQEGINAGTLKLVGTNKQTIIDEVSKLLDTTSNLSSKIKSNNPFGNGSASKKIVEILK